VRARTASARIRFSAAAAGVLLAAVAAAPRATAGTRVQRPSAVIDLRTREGVDLVKGTWRYTDARLVPAEFPSPTPGPAWKATGPKRPTLDIEPKAGAAAFDDGAWTVVDPPTLEDRRGPGKVSFAWYRIRVTVPEKVGTFSTKGSTMTFEIVVDDYAEIWIDGKLPKGLGQSGGTIIAGFNAPNRVVAARDVVPGQTVQIAVFAANGPLSDPPSNYIWVRSATLDFSMPMQESGAEEASLAVERLDPALDALVPPGDRAERVASGFSFTEGPVWSPDGYLLFSDPDDNTIYRYSDAEGVAVFKVKSGYSGPDIGAYHQPGSNGLALDAEGRLTICEHGNRRVTRMERNCTSTVLADSYQGKKLNSPNDLVYRSDGTLYFTDPPFGLPKVFDDPGKELPFSGIYRVKDGKVDLMSKELTGPNGIAFSPDEKHAYVTNWDPDKKVVLRFDVNAAGDFSNPTVFIDMGGAPGEEALDGLEVDKDGNLYVSGPGGVWIISAEGKHLGTLQLPELPANFAWGGTDGRTLYMTARTGLYRMQVGIPGQRIAWQGSH